jgi:hypothetical protein
MGKCTITLANPRTTAIEFISIPVISAK